MTSGALRHTTDELFNEWLKVALGSSKLGIRNGWFSYVKSFDSFGTTSTTSQLISQPETPIYSVHMLTRYDCQVISHFVKNIL